MTGVQEPKRQQLADELRAEIAKGTYRPGDRIPTERDLMKDAAGRRIASRETVRAALSDLRAEGLLVVLGGKRGTIVRLFDPLVTLLSSMERGKRRDNPTLALDDWAAGVIEQGRTPRQVVTVERSAEAPADITEDLPDRIGLRITAGDRVVLRHRKRWVDDRPVQTVDSWFPDWVADTELPDGSGRRPLLETGDVVLPEGILYAIGHRQVRASDRITARIADRAVLAALDLAARTVVLVHTRVGYDALDRPVRLMVTTAPTDRNVLGYEMDL